MRTNFAGFALSLGMGLIVLLIGFTALSAAGLVSLGPPVEIVAEEEFVCQGEGPAADSLRATQVAYVPANPAEASAIAAGDALFKNNCSQCHAVLDKVVGPALLGIDKRRSVEWVVKWVHNPAKVIASGDDYAVKLFQDNSQQQMPSFPQLSAAEVKNILTWIKSQEVQVTSPVESATAPAVAAR